MIDNLQNKGEIGIPFPDPDRVNAERSLCESLNKVANGENKLSLDHSNAPCSTHDECDTLQNRGYPPFWLRLPNTSFGIPMGLAGHAVMWKAAGKTDFISVKVDTEIISATFWVATLLFVTLFLAAYCVKAWVQFSLVMEECKHCARAHFLNMPHLILLMLTIAVPDNPSGFTILVGDGQQFRCIVFGIVLLLQLALTLFICDRWLFSNDEHICGPAFLISVVAWFFLSVLGTQANVEQSWGISLPTFCFGVGTIMYFVVTYFIFNGMRPDDRGSPSLFLIMTPPSVAVVAWDMIVYDTKEFATLSKLILGCSLVFFLFLAKMGVHIASPPQSFEYYWAYVFPMTALTTGTIRYAANEPSAVTGILAFTFIVLATIILIVVILRGSVHAYLVFAGKGCWGDPLLNLASLPPDIHNECRG